MQTSRINHLIAKIGQWASLLILAMAVITTLIVLLRFGFDWSAIAVQESVMYLHAFALMLVIPWALQTEDHVRVDIFYRRMRPQSQHWVNIVGAIVCLLPFCVFSTISALPFVIDSWSILEDSPQANGIPALFILKSIIPVSFALLAIQGVALLATNIKAVLAPSEECS